MTYLLFAIALGLSTVAEWYAIVGLMAIFASAPIPIAIMGALLGAAKLVIASWLYRNWKDIPLLMKTYFVLSHETARTNACAAIMSAPDGFAVSIKPKQRNLEQNALLHAMLAFIAKELPWAGKLQTAETWKRLLTAAWLRARGEQIELLPALDGFGVDVVFRHTSSLTIGEMSELIEFIFAWCVEQNVVIPTAPAIGHMKRLEAA